MSDPTEVLMDVTGQTGVLTGSWFAPYFERDGKTHKSFAIAITAGTATVVLESRNSPSDTVQTVNTLSASDQFLAMNARQYRVRLSAAAGASVRVTAGEVMRLLNTAGDRLA